MIQTILKGKRVELVPLEDKEYLIKLANIDNKFSVKESDVRELINRYGVEFWEIWLNGSRRGICGYFKFNDIYFMEALKDKDAEPTGITYSIEVGNLLLDYMFEFTDKVRTYARDTEKAIQILCLKLGFKRIYEIEGFVVYEKER
jgi:hypothetical protein